MVSLIWLGGKLAIDSVVASEFLVEITLVKWCIV